MDYNITYRKKDKGWQCIISYKLGDAWKQKSKQGYKTQKEFKDWIDDTLEELKKIADNYSDGYTFKMLFEDFCEDNKNVLSASTITNYETAYEKFKVFSDMNLEDITTEVIQNYVSSLTNLEKSSLETYLRMLKRLFNVAIKKYNVIRFNPVQDIVIPEKEVPRRERMALTPKELEAILSKFDDNLKVKTFLTIAGKAGLRCGEITGLTKDDIEEKYINVNKQWKLLRDGTYGFAILKNKNKGRRKVPIAPDLRILLDQYIPTCKSNRLFPFATSRSASKCIIRHLTIRDIDLTVHEFRHTFATNILAKGLDIKTVAYLLGDNVETVSKAYLHFTNEMMENAERIIGDNFF